MEDTPWPGDTTHPTTHYCFCCTHFLWTIFSFLRINWKNKKYLQWHYPRLWHAYCFLRSHPWPHFTKKKKEIYSTANFGEKQRFSPIFTQISKKKKIQSAISFYIFQNFQNSCTKCFLCMYEKSPTGRTSL